MTIEVWIGKDFDYTYEREALDIFVNNLELRLDNTDTLCLVLADYYIDGRQVDLTVLKRDAIITIELKECSEPFEASENGYWLTPSAHLIGNKDLNPFQQIRQYRIKWFNLLKKNKDKFRCLATVQDDRPFWNVTGIVAVSPTLHPDTKNTISSSSWWFKLCGLDKLSNKVRCQTNQWMDFSDNELRIIASEILSLKQIKATRSNVFYQNKKNNTQELRVEPYSQDKEAEEPSNTYRSLFAGCTDFSYQGFEDLIKALGDFLKSLNQVKDCFYKNLQTLENNGYWNTIIPSVKAVFGKSIKFYDTSRKEIAEIIGELQVEVKNHHISRLIRLYEVAEKLNYEYGQVWHQEYRQKDYGNPNFRILESMYAEGRDMAVNMLDIANVAYRLEDFVGKKCR